MATRRELWAKARAKEFPVFFPDPKRIKTLNSLPKSTQGRKLDRSYRPDPIERVEFAPDNSRIGEASQGFNTVVAPYWQNVSASTLHDYELGFIRMTPHVIIRSQIEDAPQMVGCKVKPTEPRLLRKTEPLTDETRKELVRENFNWSK